MLRSILKHKVDIIENSEEEIVNAIDDILFKKMVICKTYLDKKQKKFLFLIQK